jgi:hypothetical protein
MTILESIEEKIALMLVSGVKGPFDVVMGATMWRQFRDEMGMFGVTLGREIEIQTRGGVTKCLLSELVAPTDAYVAARTQSGAVGQVERSMTGMQAVTLTLKVENNGGDVLYELGCPVCRLSVNGGVDECGLAHDVALGWHFEQVADAFDKEGCTHVRLALKALPSMLRSPPVPSNVWTIPVLSNTDGWWRDAPEGTT